ncbi:MULTISPECIES: SDR family NAD(P)-dependent oxidoreductase [Paenibacillus]|uniref:SDR family NAD(P)-dependent oxidoreductase n=1 Tax=Paenibacillus violae TaxID=3077234 RepID=A0ABU3REY2_9BACL|nr:MULTISPECIES: SDR family NAD(P)-dependent oxidoreductase [Paenibacillus]MDU0202614.1 SDR family NAD(P)-dependent oxidoreductase [Paenibacillus sp. PFR10]MEC0271211.1 SDR family NAD(P)-dependent oxidoreductase [Paenibacillus anseongense]
MHIDLSGKVAIVTGAGRGIGKVIALALAKEGVTTVVTDINESNLGDIQKELDQSGCKGSTFLCDVRNYTQIQEVVQHVVDQYGGIDILVNNAGVAGGAPVDILSEKVWDLNLDINLKGTFLMCKAVAPVMKKQRSGRIMNAASFAAIVPSYGSAAYASSKAGVEQFTRVLAGELGPWNITVNCYAPGMIPTDMNHFAELQEPQQQRLLDTLTLRRWGEKTDVANLICFLASDYAGYITGTMIDISGGKLATQIPRMAYEKAAAEGTYEF